MERKKQAARKLAARKPALPPASARPVFFFSLHSRRTIRKKTGLLVVYFRKKSYLYVQVWLSDFIPRCLQNVRNAVLISLLFQNFPEIRRISLSEMTFVTMLNLSILLRNQWLPYPPCLLRENLMYRQILDFFQRKNL